MRSGGDSSPIRSLGLCKRSFDDEAPGRAADETKRIAGHERKRGHCARPQDVNIVRIDNHDLVDDVCLRSAHGPQLDKVVLLDVLQRPEKTVAMPSYTHVSWPAGPPRSRVAAQSAPESVGIGAIENRCGQMKARNLKDRERRACSRQTCFSLKSSVRSEKRRGVGFEAIRMCHVGRG